MICDNYTADQIIKLSQDNWPEIGNPGLEIVVYLNRVRDLGFAQAREVITAYGMSPGEFDILMTLRRTASPHVLTPTELQQSMIITSGGLTKLLYQLETRGLVSRSVQQHDKRSKLVHLTSKGKKTVEKTAAALIKVENKWLGDALSTHELEQLKKLLGKAARVLEERRTNRPV